MPDIYEIYAALGVVDYAPTFDLGGLAPTVAYVLVSKGRGKSRVARILRLQYNFKTWGL